MKMTKDLADFKDFLEKLSKVEIEEIEVPEFYIPNWPKEARVKIRLGKRELLFPRWSGETGLGRLVKGKKKINVEIATNGSISFEFDTWDYLSPHWSNSKSKFDRLNALFLFHQLKEELYSKIIDMLKEDVGEHDKVVEMAKKALAPFIPFLIADKLSS